MEKLKFDRKCKCDFCNCIEICAITHYGTSYYNRLVCVECAMSINQNDRAINGGKAYFDLNNSIIFFRGEQFIDCTKDYEEESEEE